MKIVKWTDGRGYIHQSRLRDIDPDTEARNGIPHDPPDLDLIDWDVLKRDLHNALVEKGLITWEDVQQQQNGVSSTAMRVFKRHIIRLYRDGG